MDQYIGRLLDGRYEILEVIGTGGMAVVYKARCHRLNRLVAIKILKDELAQDEEFRRRFRAEGEAVAMLSHPNIVQVYDVSTSDNANIIVMELIDGISLKQYMEKKGVLNWKETLHFAMQIAKGLEHAHSRGIVHRDIKPHNVMVLKNGSVKVMDFGIARVMNKSNTLTKEALGSVHYISPEQAKGGHTDNRSDLYSLSVVMYEMMAGRPPYDGESAVAVAIQHINGGAAAPSSLNPNIPGGLEQIIMKGMALEIRDRYISATEMLQDMEEFRKNPAITFAYQNMIDGATKTLPVAGVPKTAAEKAVQARSGGRAPSESIKMQPVSASQRKNPDGTPVREAEIIRRGVVKKTAPKKKDPERSRVATTAIVICSAVAVVAIVIFLVALFNGALLNQEKNLVEVPYLEGEMYGEGFAARYSDFTIRLQPKEYSNAYDAGQIMHQEPAGGSKVQKGSDLWLTVSMGEEPPVRKMDNFIGVELEEAKAVLENLGYTVLTRYESSFVYEAGLVTRTDPAAQTELTAGQTVYFYVSTGPSVVEAKMPNVVGMEASRAIELLEQLGFTSVKTEYVESQKPKNEVIYQSVESNTVIDVNTEITLLLSEGPKETEPETDPTETTLTDVPDETEPQAITVRVGIVVPIRDEDYALDVCIHGTKDVVTTKLVAAGSGNTTVELTGTGIMEFDLYIDGVYENTLKVKFNVD